MLENFFVYHRNGQCLLSASYGERKLTLEYVTGLRAASSTLFSFVARWNTDEANRNGVHDNRQDTAAALKPASDTNVVTSPQEGQDIPKHSALNDGITELSVNDTTFQFLELGVYMLIAQGSRSTPKTCLSRTLAAVRDTMQFFLGTFDNISQDLTLFASISDIVHYILDSRSELISLTTGVPLIPLSSRTQSILDRLLSGLEDNHNVYGSALILGRSVLHKRLPVQNTRMMLQLVSARPMKSCMIRSVPIFVDGKAQNMFLLRLTSNLILGVFVHITASYNELLPYLDHLEASLDDDMFKLPREEPPIQLRTYTGLDTLAFVYSDSNSGQVIVPASRFDEGQKSLNSKITESFHWFYENVMLMEGDRPINQITLSNGEYIFHHIQRNDHIRLSVLYSSLIDGNVNTLTEEILDNVRRSSIA